MRIVEGNTGMWHYHLAADDSRKALCGETRVMERLIPIAYWNKTPQNYHISESWCEACDRIANDRLYWGRGSARREVR